LEIDTAINYKQKEFTTEVFSNSICIVAPSFFIDLVEATLNGWSFIEKHSDSIKRDVVVMHKNDSFYIDSIVLDQPKVVDDLLDALNEFFLCLSYLVVNKTKGFKLLHCASYAEADKNIITVGPKNSGKSELILSKAITGKRIYSDDLLLWSTEKGIFISLGLPLRLRRTAISLIKDKSTKEKFLVGKNILYSHRNFFDNAKLGVEFSLDELKVMDRSFKEKDVSIYKLLSCIGPYLISDRFFSHKKYL
jgi:hypothetical protein